MKILILFIIFISPLLSQNKKDSIIIDKNSFYFEIGGNSVAILCMNYEYKFLNQFIIQKENFSSLSLRLGLGIGFLPVGLITMVNWQIGKNKSKLEFGLGTVTNFLASNSSVGSYLEKYKQLIDYTFTVGIKFLFYSGLIIRLD